jgi:hypothetical protein
MQYTPGLVAQLIQAIPWQANSCIRLFWLRHHEGSRDELAVQLSAFADGETVVPLVLRFGGFKDANAVLSDAMALFDAHRQQIESLADKAPERLTFLILSKEDFRLVNASSPIELPDWFPVNPRSQTYFSINDLGHTAELKPLNFAEARMDHVAELLFALEEAITAKLWAVYETDTERCGRCVDALQPGSPKGADAKDSLETFSAHLAAAGDPRAYRPNAGDKSKFLAARIIKLLLGNTPKQVTAAAEELGKHLHGSGTVALKPTFFAVMWRPPSKVPVEISNWHAVLVAFFQVYQLMNAHAHAGEFPPYPASLQFANSLDLRRFLVDAKAFVEDLH